MSAQNRRLGNRKYSLPMALLLISFGVALCLILVAILAVVTGDDAGGADFSSAALDAGAGTVYAPPAPSGGGQVVVGGASPGRGRGGRRRPPAYI